MRVSFIGDVMCEPMLIQQARRKDGTFDFSSVFERCTCLFDRSDYVVANLETPIAGAELGLSRSLFSFNAPVEFLAALESAGISCVTTANNHAFDRGVEGAVRTVRALEDADLDHVGMALGSDAALPLYNKMDGRTIAIISYSYGVNCRSNECDLSGQSAIAINLLRPQDDRQNPSGSADGQSVLKRVLLRLTSKEQRIALKKKLGMSYYTAYRDDVFDEATIAPYLERLTADIEVARTKADTVICCLHMGGQFNAVPGKFSEHVAKAALRAGCDAVIASHPHVVQKAILSEGRPVFFSLGNFTMSPDSVYVLHEHHPEYGLVAHLDIEDGRIAAVSFSIVKIVMQKGRLVVWPVDDLHRTLTEPHEKELLEREVREIRRRVSGRDPEDDIIRSEYPLQK